MARRRQRSVPIVSVVDDDLYDELIDLTGQRIVHAIVWEESLLEALEKEEIDAEALTLFDLDLYLEEGIYFELYATGCHPDPESEPLQGLSAVEHRIRSLVAQPITSCLRVPKQRSGHALG